MDEIKSRGTALRRRRRMSWAAAVSLVVVGAVGLFVFTSGPPATNVHVAAVPTSSTGPGSTPTLSPTTSAPWASPSRIACEDAFFPASTWATLNQRFGDTQCFRFTGERQWVVFGDGDSFTTPAALAPGGVMTAVLDCGVTDSTCLDPGAPHSFADFTVYYPPRPQTPGTLLATSGGRLLQITVGPCGPLVFDLQSRQWFRGLAADIDAIMSAVSPPSPLSVPSPLPGTTAVSATASSAGACP